MAFEILDGQALKYRRGGTLDVGVTDVVPDGQFLIPGTATDVYTVCDVTTRPVVFLNLVKTDRPDCTDGGVSTLAGPYTLETDVFDASAVLARFGALTVKKVGASVSGILTDAGTGDYIHGWVLETPAAGNGFKLRAMMVAANDGKK